MHDANDLDCGVVVPIENQGGVHGPATQTGTFEVEPLPTGRGNLASNPSARSKRSA
jgi:hypothetical protein